MNIIIRLIYFNEKEIIKRMKKNINENRLKKV